MSMCVSTGLCIIPESGFPVKGKMHLGFNFGVEFRLVRFCHSRNMMVLKTVFSDKNPPKFIQMWSKAKSFCLWTHQIILNYWLLSGLVGLKSQLAVKAHGNGKLNNATISEVHGPAERVCNADEMYLCSAASLIGRRTQNHPLVSSERYASSYISDKTPVKH